MSCDEACIRKIDATKTRGAGHRMTKSVRDLRGDQRTITKTFRGEGSLERAIDAREEIDRLKSDANWLRRRFGEPKSHRRTKTLLGDLGVDDPDLAYQDPPDEPDPVERLRGMTLQGWILAGILEDPGHPDAVSDYVPDPDPDVVGWIRESMDRHTTARVRTKIAAWGYIRAWGRASSMPPRDVTIEHLKGFRRYLEGHPDLNAKSTIKTYLKAFRQSVNQWSIRVNEKKPIRGKLDHARTKGAAPKTKVVPPKTLRQLQAGFDALRSDDRERSPRGRLLSYFNTLLLCTGMRSSEALFIRLRDIDRDSQTIHLCGAVTNGRDIGPLKEGKLSGDPSKTKSVPLLDPALAAIDAWVEEREEYGYPPANKCDRIFCSRDARPFPSNKLWSWYKKASDRAGLDEIVSPHMIRHSLNDYLRSAGVSIEVRKAILGHASDEVNKTYTEPQAEEARGGLETLGRELNLNVC